jgi:hypothetical protein
MIITINSPGRPNHPHEIIGGYQKDGRPNIVTGESNSPIVYTLVCEDAYWGGGLQPTFYEKFQETSEGDEFRYRSKRHTRMRDLEIEELVTNKIFQIKTPPLP